MSVTLSTAPLNGNPMPMFPWNSGDVLYAAALNAAFNQHTGGSAYISATPPTNPTVGQFWYDLVGGQTYCWVNDGTSSQWVVANNPGGLVDAPSDGNTYARQSGTWVQALPLSGGTMLGAITLAADPTANLQAATKQYVDAHSGTGGGSGYLPLSGGALTGPLTLAADPAAALQPVTLQYYNAHVPTATSSSYLPLAGGHMTGYMTSATSGSTSATLENLPTLDFLGNTINFQRQITNATPGAVPYGGVRVFLSNQSSHWAMQPWGGYNGAPAFYAQATAAAGSNGSTSAIAAWLNSAGNNAYTSQDVGISSNVNKTGQNSTWAIATQTQDQTGLAPGSFASIGIEIDIVANGPDNAASLYNPSLANRYLVYLAAKPNPTYTYAASTHFNVGNIVVQTPSGGVATCYICNTAGTTGASPPTWPTSGTVADGTVNWTTGTTQASSYSGIFLGASDSTVTVNTAFGVQANIGNACIDLTLATMTNSTCAAIRLGPDQPIDFTGGGSNANKNRRILSWSSYFDGLAYQALGQLVAVWGDDGSVAMGGRIQLAGGTNFSGVTTGYNDGYLTIGKNFNGNGEIDMITGAGPGGLSLFSTNGAGVIAAPYVTFISGVNPAIAVGANKVIGTQIAGWGTPTGGTRTASFPGASATLAQTSAVVAQLITDLKTHGLLGA